MSDPSSDHAALLRLRRRGFTPRQAERLLALRRRYDRGDVRAVLDRDRLRFARYLLRHGWIGDWGPTRGTGRTGST